MNKEEYKANIEVEYIDDPEGFKIFLKMLFEFFLKNYFSAPFSMIERYSFIGVSQEWFNLLKRTYKGSVILVAGV